MTSNDSYRISDDAHECATRLFPKLNWYDREPIALEIQNTIDEGTSTIDPCNDCEMCENCSTVNELESKNASLQEEIVQLELRLIEAQMITESNSPVCQGCGRSPAEISEYVEAGYECGMSPKVYVWKEERTLNKENGHFLCTTCYVKAGMPTTPGGWKCP